jgi:hypothetical protein
MNMKKLIVLMLSVVVLTNCYAQKPAKKDKKGKETTETVVTTPEPAAQPEESNVITEECVTNMSLFSESAKNKQYADALEPWNQVFQNCPFANKAVYSQGRAIVQWELSQQKDPESYQKVFDKLMLLFDKRIRYFGNDEKYPTAWIKGQKAIDYVIFAKNDDLKKVAYQWLDESIEGMRENSEIEVLRQFVVLSDRLYVADKAHGEKYIADYLKANAYLELLTKSEDAKKAELAAQYKNGLDILFAQSGAAKCETLDNLYTEKVKQNSTDLSYLNKILSFYKRVKCTDSKVYFSAAVSAHKIQPTAESASALAGMSYNSGSYTQAITYFDEATQLSDNNDDKAEYQYKIAQIYYSKLENYPKVKTYGYRSLEFKNNGNAYLIIGLAYAAAKGIFDDPVLSKTVFWIAVDKFNKAKQVDPSLAPDADKLISTYAKHFPSKEDIFFKPELQNGKSFFVGGWIGESTICR